MRLGVNWGKQLGLGSRGSWAEAREDSCGREAGGRKLEGGLIEETRRWELRGGSWVEEAEKEEATGALWG